MVNSKSKTLWGDEISIFCNENVWTSLLCIVWMDCKCWGWELTTSFPGSLMRDPANEVGELLVVSYHLPVSRILINCRLSGSQKVQKGKLKIERDREGRQNQGVYIWLLKLAGHFFGNLKKVINSFTISKWYITSKRIQTSKITNVEKCKQG